MQIYVFPIKNSLNLSNSTGFYLCTHTNVPFVLPKSNIFLCSSITKCLVLTVGAFNTCSTYAFLRPKTDLHPELILNEIFDSYGYMLLITRRLISKVKGL